jgi:serine protease inhibitor
MADPPLHPDAVEPGSGRDLGLQSVQTGVLQQQTHHQRSLGQTGGLLQEQTKELELSQDAVFALASAIYFTGGWDEEFDPTKTADAVFHCKNGDLTTAFMNKTITFGTYYWGSSFGAVRLELSKGGMWLILPDEGKTMEDILNSTEYLTMIQAPYKWENKKTIKINLSLPKFDISSRSDLISGMQQLGLTDVFNPYISDFTPITDADELCVGKIDHAVRVAIDEDGVVAAGYTVIEVYDTGMPIPPENEIDFVLDRPFLFLIAEDIPLFAGVVEQP